MRDPAISLASGWQSLPASAGPNSADSIYIGGCRAFTHRANFHAKMGCTGTRACDACGRVFNVTTKQPSGMRFPRTNVPQYGGNAVWDGNAITFSEAISAMLGDPFQFAVSPELDALRQLLMEPASPNRIAALERRWSLDRRYCAFPASRFFYQAFMSGMSALSAAHVQGHADLRYVAPAVRRQIDAMLRSSGTGPNMGREAATCAAVAIMDALFATWDAADIWKTSLKHQRMTEANQGTLFNALYLGTRMASKRFDDPHGTVYSTIHQSIALGFYGGNATVVYSAADDTQGGSGVDLQWMTSRECPGPPPLGVSSAAWRQRWCDALSTTRVVEDARIHEDSGEILTPNYKTPREVEGIMLHEWMNDRHCDGFHRGQSELAPLTRPLGWAFFRTSGDQILVLAPGLVRGPGVFAIDHFSYRSPQRFFAAQRSVIGTPKPVAPGIAYDAHDRAVGSDVEIPVWGILHRCSEANLALVPSRGAGGSSKSLEGVRRCIAAETLWPHALRTQSSYHSAVMTTSLPPAIVSAIGALRVWPSDAKVDVAASNQVQSNVSSPNSVCVVTVAMLHSKSLQKECFGQ